MREGVLFVAANILAAVLNYLYQVLASRQLTPSEFAALNGWIANLAPLFIFSAMLQYQANFHPARQSVLRWGGGAACLLALPAVLVWWNLNSPTGVLASLLVFLFTAVMAWQTGQVQIRLNFKALAVMSLLLAVIRIAFTQLPLGSTFAQFVFANLGAAAVVVLLFTGILWKAGEVPVKSDSDFWRRATVLSVAGAMLPQFDMLLMNHTQPHEDFVLFVQAALYGRAVYALTTIMAAWLLPNQIHGRKIMASPPMWMTASGIVLICALVAAASPMIAQHIFGWAQAPDRILVFLASVELSFLAVIFVTVQTACAKHDLRRAAMLLTPLAVEAVIQMVFRLPVISFLLMAVTVQLATLLIVPGQLKSKL